MPAIFGNVGASAGEVNEFHSNSDVDKSTLSQHHTLGIQPNQASPGDHNHNGRNSRRIQTDELVSPDVAYQPLGDALITSPTFSGDPLIEGSYTKIGSLVYFEIRVDFDNITSFGAGQYYLTLPFPSAHPVLFAADVCMIFPATTLTQLLGTWLRARMSCIYLAPLQTGATCPLLTTCP